MSFSIALSHLQHHQKQLGFALELYYKIGINSAKQNSFAFGLVLQIEINLAKHQVFVNENLGGCVSSGFNLWWD